MKIEDSLIGLVAVDPEYMSQMSGCTYCCRHVSATLDEGKPMIIYPVRFTLSEGKALDVAFCRECYVRNHAARN
jgi:hypothetical protein